MRIGIVGGTGKLGGSLAVRWAKHEVRIGSRDPAKAVARAEELARLHGHPVLGASNQVTARDAELVVLSVPYAAHGATLREILGAVHGKVVIDTTVPLRPPAVSRVELPPGRAAALEAQAILGPETPVASAFHHVSAAHLADPARPIDCDVLVVADEARARTAALGLVRDLGLRGVDAGPLANAVALESLTPVLIHVNRTYKIAGAGVRLTGLPPG